MQASKKVGDAKLARDFQAVLKEFQKAQKLAAERETAYTPFVPEAVFPSRSDIAQARNHLVFCSNNVGGVDLGTCGLSSYIAGELKFGPEETLEQRALLVEQRRCVILKTLYVWEAAKIVCLYKLNLFLLTGAGKTFFF